MEITFAALQLIKSQYGVPQMNLFYNIQQYFTFRI